MLGQDGAGCDNDGMDETSPERPVDETAAPAAGPEDRELDAFWTEARTRARFDWIGAYGGPTVLGSLRPPAWSFGSSPQEADEFLARLLDSGAPVSTTSARGDYDAEDVPLPERGAVSIVLDGTGHPCALVATSAVTVDEDTVTEELTLLYPTKRHR